MRTEYGSILIENDGSRIVSTNFWHSTLAASGKLFASLVPEACRLLLPPNRTTAMREELLGVAADVAQVVVSIPRPIWEGSFYGMPLGNGMELLWDDGSRSPYVLHLGLGQVHSLIRPEERSRDIRVTVWCQGEGDAARRLFDFPGRLHQVPRLPYTER
jgi:hypothetical protein